MSEITYQNKDVTSKFLSEGLKDKSLKVYGIRLPKIVNVLPTNLPAIEANELRLDNLFQFEDGSYGIVDYESDFKENDKIDYLNYLARVLKRFQNQGISAPIHMIVLYTCNVKNVNTKMDIGCLQFTIKAGYLRNIDTYRVFKKLNRKILHQKLLNDRALMEMIVLPLTRPTVTEQKEWLKKTIELAKTIKDEKQQVFVLSGILTFSDKIIETDYAKEVREWIQMTKVAKIFEREKEEAVAKVLKEKEEAIRQANIFKMLLKGDTIIHISQKTGVSEEEIRELIK